MTKQEVIDSNGVRRDNIKRAVEDYLRRLKDKETYSDREFAESMISAIDEVHFADNYILRIESLRNKIRSRSISNLGVNIRRVIPRKDLVKMILLDRSNSEVLIEYLDPSSFRRATVWVPQRTGASRSLWDLYCMWCAACQGTPSDTSVPKFIELLITVAKKSPAQIGRTYCGDVGRTVFYPSTYGYSSGFETEKLHNCLFVRNVSLLDIQRVFREMDL